MSSPRPLLHYHRWRSCAVPLRVTRNDALETHLAHLLRTPWQCFGPVLLRVTRSRYCEAGRHGMQVRTGAQVSCRRPAGRYACLRILAIVRWLSCGWLSMQVRKRNHVPYVSAALLPPLTCNCLAGAQAGRCHHRCSGRFASGPRSFLCQVVLGSRPPP